jgi:hypothetical protein
MLIDPNHARQLTSSTIAYAAVILSVKLSILLLYRRVFSIDHFINIGTLIGIVGVMILHIPYIGTQMYTVISCATPSSLINNNFCSHLYTINVSQSGANLVTDFYILILPLPRIWGLKLEMHRKLGLCAVFAAGLVACVVSVVRLVLMVKTLSLQDFTWGTSVTIELSYVPLSSPSPPPFTSPFFLTFRFANAKQSSRSKRSNNMRLHDNPPLLPRALKSPRLIL